MTAAPVATLVPASSGRCDGCDQPLRIVGLTPDQVTTDECRACRRPGQLRGIDPPLEGAAWARAHELVDAAHGLADQRRAPIDQRLWLMLLADPADRLAAERAPHEAAAMVLALVPAARAHIDSAAGSIDFGRILAAPGLTPEQRVLANVAVDLHTGLSVTPWRDVLLALGGVEYDTVRQALALVEAR